MELTIHQKSIVDKVISSLKVNTYTLLSGLAGTGKTFSTKFIVKDILSKYKSVAITSTTNQAASVLAKELGSSIGITVLTINKFLAMKPMQESRELTLRTLDYNKIEIVDYLIIDEFSMITQVVIDTLEHYRLKYNPKLKILLVGDATQLILEPNTIKQLNLDKSTFFLTEPMRAKKNSSIAEYGVKASEAIRTNVKPPEILFDKIKDITKYKDHTEFINAWKKVTEEKNPEDIKILCYTNAKVKSYNKNIKELYYKQEEEYAKGNVIILRNPVFLQPIEIVNGKPKATMIPNNTRVTINRVEPLVINCLDETTEEGYTIYPDGYSGKYFYIPKSKAALTRFLQPMVDKKDWKNYYLNKDKFAIAHHAEAGTFHSAQGSSFDEVFIDGTDMMTAREFISRLAYVGITRARIKVHIYLGTERNFKAFKK